MAVHPSAQLLTGGSGAGLRITQPLLYLLSAEGSSVHRFAAPLFPCRRTRIDPSCPHLWGHRADGTSQRPVCAGTPRWGWGRVPKPPQRVCEPHRSMLQLCPEVLQPRHSHGRWGPRSPHPSLTQGCPRCPGGIRRAKGTWQRAGQERTERQKGWRRRGSGDGDRTERDEGTHG